MLKKLKTTVEVVIKNIEDDRGNLQDEYENILMREIGDGKNKITADDITIKVPENGIGYVGRDKEDKFDTPCNIDSVICWNPDDGYIRKLENDSVVASAIAEYAKNGTIIKESFQRGEIWTEEKYSLLCDSLISGIAIPSLILVELEDGTLSILDGQQRIMAIKNCIADNRPFTVLSDMNSVYNGKTFSELPKKIQTKISTRSIPVIKITDTDPARAYTLETFKRVNITGLNLSRQEIRHGIYKGEFRDMVCRLEDKDENWRKLTSKIPKRDRMKGKQEITRFFALFNLSAYIGIDQTQYTLENLLDVCTAASNLWDKDKIAYYEKLFKDTTASIVSTIGEHAFLNTRKTLRGKASRRFKDTIADSIMIAFATAIENNVKFSDNLEERRENLVNDSIFTSCNTAHTTQVKNTKARIGLAQRFLFDMC